MKKNIYLNIFTAVMCLGLCFCFLGSGHLGGENISAQMYQAQTAEEIKGTYLRGEEFVVPSAEIVYENQNIPADEHKVVFPKGNIYSRDSFLLTEAGIYTINYYAVTGGKKIKAEKQFKVVDTAYSVGSDFSSVKYVDTLPGSRAEQSGLSLSLVSGDTFTFNKPIDISNSDLSTPLIKMYPYSFSTVDGVVQKMEVSNIIVRLTDCYDDSNYVEILFYMTPASIGYYRAGASNQISSGLGDYSGSRANIIIGSGRREVFIDGVRHCAFYNEAGATAGRKTSDEHGKTYYYDYASQEIWAQDRSKIIVTDLNSPDVYDNNLYEGFTTGEVYLSIYATEYMSDVMRVDIAEIYKHSGEELNLTTFEDKTKPNIEVDFDYGGDIYIAKNEPFEIFDAKVFDVNLLGELKTAVYYNYGTENQTQVGIYNGTFIPNRAGNYTIVYSAKDGNGNPSYYTVTLTSIECDNDVSIAFSTTKLTSLPAGKEVVLPEYSATSINGAVEVKITAVIGDTETEINSQTRSFIPMAIGTCRITYTYGDGIKTYTYSYEIDAQPSDGIQIETPVLPDYFIKGMKYTLNEVKAYTFAEGAVKTIATQSYVSEDGGAYKGVDLAEYKVQAQNSVNFKFVHQTAEYITQERTVVDVGYGNSLKMQNYFAGDFVKTADGEGVYYASNVQSGDNTLEYINAVSLSLFEFSFVVDKEYANFDSVSIKLIDYYDRTNFVTLTYVNKGNSTAVRLNDGAELPISQAFAGNIRSIWYAGSQKAFSEERGGTLYWTNTFSSDLILLQVTLEGISGQSKINIKKVNNQPMSNLARDYINPTIIVKNEYGGIRSFGDEVILYAAQVSDELSPFVVNNLTFRVQRPDKGYAVSTDGITLDDNCNPLREYRLKLTEYGEYTVAYIYMDQNNRPYNINYKITVADREPPVLTPDKGYNEDTVLEHKRGDKITIAGYTAEDNMTASESLFVKTLVLHPNNNLSYLGEEKSFIANLTGDYKVYYYCYDEQGNYTIRYYTIRVR